MTISAVAAHLCVGSHFDVGLCCLSAPFEYHWNRCIHLLLLSSDIRRITAQGWREIRLREHKNTHSNLSIAIQSRRRCTNDWIQDNVCRRCFNAQHQLTMSNVTFALRGNVMLRWSLCLKGILSIVWMRVVSYEHPHSEHENYILVITIYRWISVWNYVHESWKICSLHCTPLNAALFMTSLC